MNQHYVISVLYLQYLPQHDSVERSFDCKPVTVIKYMEGNFPNAGKLKYAGKNVGSYSITAADGSVRYSSIL
jgi:hypothetical protein